MALRTPPSWLQNGSHPAENDRLSMQSIISSSGIIGSSSLAVTQAGTPAMAVQVAAGWGAVVGDYTTNMGVYQFYNDAATQLTITTANPTNPRIDRVVVTINDSYYTGATNNVTFTVVAGTPAVSPTAPATPTNSISLATVAVAAGATSIVNANITDTRSNITTNLPVGDLTEVQAGTGISVASGTGPIPIVSVDATVLSGYATTATAGGTTTLTAASVSTQFFTGTLNQTITLPVASTMALGEAFVIHNNSTGTLTVNSSGGNLVVSISGNNTYLITCILTSGTTAASWDSDFTGTSTTTGSGSTVLSTSPSISGATLTGTSTINAIADGTTATGASGAGFMGLPQNATTTGAYGIVAADAGKHIYSSATRTVTIPANGTIALPIGTTITFISGVGATTTIAITTDTMYLSSAGTTGSRTLAQYGMATAVKIAATTWIISGNGLT
jgi:hypothetical protein